MKTLLYKEWKLALHPTCLIFLSFSAMLLIPSYPYYVPFFYTSLGIFFLCLTGRENHDFEYGMNLPVRKRDLVRARILFAVCIELLQLLVSVPFAVVRNLYPESLNNPVGAEANVAFFGMVFLMFGIFNLIFFPQYYHNPDRIGIPFLWGGIAEFVYLGVAEVCAHLPVLSYVLDTKDPQYLLAKIGVLLVGILLFVGLTTLACRQSEREFEKLDL